MKKNKLVINGILLGFIISAQAQPNSVFDICPLITDALERLACYDEFADRKSLDDNSGSTRQGEEGVRAIQDLATANELVERGIPPATNPLTYTPRVLSSDGPNIFGISSSPRFRKPGDHGERSHFEFNVSIKYPLMINDRSVRSKQNTGWPNRLPERFFFIYNGSYDFHALNNFKAFNETKVDWYRSAPVISRDQNPGFAAEWDLVADGSRKLRFGLMHHSNGQPKSYSSPDTDDTDDQKAAKEAEKQALIAEINSYIHGEEGENYALQDLSRSSNYVQLRYQRILDGKVEGGQNWKQYQLEVRPHYFGVDDEIFWEAGLGDRPKITDYDGLRFQWEHYDSESIFNFLPRSSAFIKRVELKTGISDFSQLGNISSQLSLGWKWDNLTVVGYWFSGYGKELSTYHYRSHHWGVGLELR